MSEYISRNEAYQKLHNAGGCDATDEWSKGYDDGITEAIRITNEIPAADVAPVMHGYWCEDEFDVWCSNCRYAYPKDRTGIASWRKISKYCDNCGAKMDKGVAPHTGM